MRTLRAADQLAMHYDEREWAEYEGDKLLREIGRTVSLIGPKVVAIDLNTTEAALAHAVAKRGRHYFRAEYIPYLVAKSPDDELARALVAPGGYVVERAPDMTDAERVASLERVLGEHLGPELRAALLERAYRGRK